MLEAQKTQPGHRVVPCSPASMLVWDLPLAETLWGFSAAFVGPQLAGWQFCEPLCCFDWSCTLTFIRNQI